MDIINFVLHIDKHLLEYAHTYGHLLYWILFAIIFMETGFVVTPFLPGDSLLFAAGALCPMGYLNVWALMGLLIIAAFLGNVVNFLIGKKLGPALLEKEKIPFIKKEYILKAKEFYETHGTKAVVMSRFIPIVRTFVPFVAGIAQMNTARFVLWTFLSALIWVIPITAAGYFFGNIPIVKNNFSIVVLGIIFVSILPGIIAYVREKSKG
jgi:membrane-associated protein